MDVAVADEEFLPYPDASFDCMFLCSSILSCNNLICIHHCFDVRCRHKSLLRYAWHACNGPQWSNELINAAVAALVVNPLAMCSGRCVQLATLGKRPAGVPSPPSTHVLLLELLRRESLW